MAFSLLSVAALALAGGAQAATTSFNPMFYVEDWPEQCNTGKKQTPINIVPSTTQPLPESLMFEPQFPTVQGVKVKNTGNALQVEWDSFTDATKDMLSTVPGGGNAVSAILNDPENGGEMEVKLQPIQFHMHAVSEHTVDGLYYPVELHMVHLVAEGSAPAWGCDKFWQTGNATDINLEKCAAVFGVLFKLGETSPSWFTTFLKEAPKVAGNSVPSSMTTFDMMQLVPSMDFYTYEGSLTTPGCNEGLRWHVFAEPLEIAPRDMEALQMWQATTKKDDVSEDMLIFRDDHRPIQELNGRTVYATSGAMSEGTSGVTEDGTNSAPAAARMLSALTAAVTLVMMLLN